MPNNEIKLQYSGFIIFAAKMLSVASGLIFQLMIARATSDYEYDLWFNINDILAYFMLLAAALPFWSMRFVARGKEGAVKTGLIANLIISAIATTVYLALVPLITLSLGISQEYLLLYFVVSVQIMELYSINTLQASLRARIPQTIGYGLLIGEVCKVTLGFVLIIIFQQPLLGALVSLITAYTVQIAYYLKLFEKDLRQHVHWEYVKEWIKGSAVNIYRIVGNQIASFVFIMLFIYGGEGARSRYGLAKQVASVIAHSFFLSFALYPRLLIQESREDITTSIKTVSMFAIPMAAGAIALSDSYIIIMKGAYRDASPILALLAIDTLVVTASTLFSSIIFGVETVDEEARISLRKLAKSRLFIAFSLPYFHSAMTLPTAFFVLTNYAQNQPLQAAIYVSVINTSARLVTFSILYNVVRRTVTISIPWRNIAKYVSAAAVMATFLTVIPHPTKIHLTLIATALGGVIYLAFLTLIDKETKSLILSLWQEVRYRVKGVIS